MLTKYLLHIIKYIEIQKMANHMDIIWVKRKHPLDFLTSLPRPVFAAFSLKVACYGESLIITCTHFRLPCTACGSR